MAGLCVDAISHRYEEMPHYGGVQWKKMNTPPPSSVTKQFKATQSNVARSCEYKGAADFP